MLRCRVRSPTVAKKQNSSRPVLSRSGAGVDVVDGADIPVVGLREPCPCGSGRRYKACHGRGIADAGQTLVHRPFEGLESEGDWVALREIVPAATAPLTLAPQYAARLDGRTVTLATVLPMAWPALVRKDGQILLGLQTTTGSGDTSRDIAGALLRALDAELGSPVPPVRSGDGPRLQDLLAPVPLEIRLPDIVDEQAGIAEIELIQRQGIGVGSWVMVDRCVHGRPPLLCFFYFRRTSAGNETMIISNGCRHASQSNTPHPQVLPSRRARRMIAGGWN